jgi:glutamine synthetase
MVFFLNGSFLCLICQQQSDSEERARLARKLRLETMIEIRAHVDAAEGLVPPNLWTLATYKELLFMDQHV